MDFHKDYYKILGVEKNATREQMKSAYRKLVLKYHPDRNPGDDAAVEKMKEVNEAYEILDSDINRFIYDEYKQNEERIKSEETAKDDINRKAEQPNRKTYERKTIVRTNRRVYVRGTISVKFWADQESELNLFIMKEIYYKLNPVSAEAVIINSNIHNFTAPNQFQKAYKQAEIFKTPLPNPVKCRIISEGGAEEYYDLSLHDVRIIDPVLTDIVKHEKQSLGTLNGEFFGYVLRIDEEEVIETVTECFGATGRTEKKIENETEFFRNEYYHKDCTTYWGPWIAIPKPAAERKPDAKTPVVSTNYEGCSQYWWIPILLLFLFIWPQFFLGLLGIILIGFLFSIGAGLLARLLPFLGLLLLGFFIYSAFNSGAGRSIVLKREFKPSYDTLKSTKEPITQDSTGSVKKADTLISHFIRWKDYDSITYAVILSVTTTDVNNSIEGHNSFEPTGFYNSLTPVYNYLENSDQIRLRRIYSAFDSIRNANALNSIAFAKMVVSCIQSIPYYLVVDQSCNDDYSNDEFIYNYLQQCDRECCVGNTKYGVRSPVEFISDLKGDCDTRALIIYSVLKKFNYNVALLTSQYYKHAIIAVNFENEILDGLAMNVNNKNYYLWETTSVGFQPGFVPEQNRDLSHWEIALLNEKK